MPWTITSRTVDGPPTCPACRTCPADNWSGPGKCPDCGSIVLCSDPPPGEAFRLTLIPCDDVGRRLPRRQRRTIRIEWGERTQHDGTVAKVFRLINRQTDEYGERVTHADGSVLERKERLSDHRGHGSARDGLSAQPATRKRRWVDLDS